MKETLSGNSFLGLHESLKMPFLQNLTIFVANQMKLGGN